MALTLLATTDTQIIRVVEALYNQRPGNTYLSNFQTFVSENSIDALANALAANFASSTDAELAAIITTNLGLGDAAAAGNAYLEGQFAADPAGRGKAVLDAMNALSGLESDATYGAAAASFNADVVASLNYSTDSSNTAVVASTGTVAGSTFNLTTAIDNLTGSSSDDTFYAINEANVAAGDTLSVADVINGGDGTDTLNITNTQSGAVAGLTTSNIEALVIRSTDEDDTADTLNMTSLSGVTSVTLNSFTDGLTVSNATLGTTFAMNDFVVDNAADDVTVGYKSATGSTDTASVSTSQSTLQQVVVDAIETLTLTNSGATVTSIASLDAAQATTINVVNSTASVSTNSGLTVTAVGDNTATTMNISGAGSTKFTGVMSTGLTTLNAADATGNLNLNVSSNTNNLTATMGSGDDRLNVGTVGTNLTATDTYAMGDGTDTMAIADETLSAQDITDIKSVSGLEQLEFTATGGDNDMAVSANALSTIDKFILSGAAAVGTAGAAGLGASAAVAGTVAMAITTNDGDVFKVSGAAITGGVGGAGEVGSNGSGGSDGVAAANGAAAITIANLVDGGANAATIELAGGVTITGGAGGAAGDGGDSHASAGVGGAGGDGAAAISAATIETLNIVSTGTTANAIVGGAGGAVGSDGDTSAAGGAVGSTAAAITVNTNATINVTGTRDINIGTISGTNASVNAADFTGKLTVVGEAGNNTIVGGSKVDTITGGAGVDTMTGGASADIFIFATDTDAEQAQTTGSDTNTITDYSADILRLDTANNVAGVATGAVATSNIAIDSNGLATFATADDTLAEKIVAVKADADIAANEVVIFNHDSDTYVYGAGTNTGTAAADFMIKLAGVTLTSLTESTVTAGDFSVA